MSLPAHQSMVTVAYALNVAASSLHKIAYSLFSFSSHSMSVNAQISFENVAALHLGPISFLTLGTYEPDPIKKRVSSIIYHTNVDSGIIRPSILMFNPDHFQF